MSGRSVSKLLKQSFPPGAFSILQRINRILRRRYLFLDEMRPWRVGKRTDFHFTTTLAPAEAMELEHLYGVSFSCLDSETNKSIAQFAGQPKYPEVMRRIRPGSKVLDLGCGPGVLMHDLTNHLGCRCVGLDLIPGNVERLKGLGYEARECNLSNMFDPNLVWAAEQNWDYVISTGGALQNFSYPTKIAEIFRSATIIFQVYNTGYWFHRLRLLCGRFPYTPTSLYNTPNQEYRAELHIFRIYWTLRDFREIFRAAGFDVEEFACRGMPWLDLFKWNAFFELTWSGHSQEESFEQTLARSRQGTNWTVKNAW